jgi:hypothetical protein
MESFVENKTRDEWSRAVGQLEKLDRKGPRTEFQLVTDRRIAKTASGEIFYLSCVSCRYIQARPSYILAIPGQSL